MFGLYDTDGILRYVCKDPEACLAYAELFGLQSIDCSLMALPEPNHVIVKGQKNRNRNRVASSN